MLRLTRSSTIVSLLILTMLRLSSSRFARRRKDLKEALQWYYKAAKADANNANAVVYLGAGLYTAAAKIYENTNVTAAMAKTADDLLRAAVPALEIAYKTRPDNIKAMLSSIYYQLKMNDKH